MEENTKTVTEAEEKESVSKNFIEREIEKDLAEGVYNHVQTRFPPEPNGYLHIGHAKSIILNSGLAEEYHGKFNLRFDDTNPTKEKTEFVQSIIEDVKWLGAEFEDRLFFASDYFEKMYECAVLLIKKGKAFVCDLSAEQIREYRGDFNTPGKESPYRNRSIEENLELFENMKNGMYKDGEKVLRAKIDMASPNVVMRDPTLYRIRHAEHHRTGDKWCVYPMYDFTHCLSDSLEGITHSICTLEFVNNRELYDWVLDELRPLADESHYRADRHEAFRKVKRINSCSRHQLGIARELAAWREDRAERRNIPRKWVMSDDTLLALVKRNPVRVEEFRSIRGTDQLGERDVDGALMAIKRGASCPHDRLPLMVRGHRQISPELESVTDLMYALIRLVAERSGVATSVIASRDDLADYIEHPEQSPLREGWRFELVGSRLDDLLSGNMGLTVKDGKIELL